MPRTFPVDLNYFEEYLKKEKNRFYNSSSKTFKPPKDEIWQLLSKQFDNKISSKHIYTIVKSNRKGIWDRIEIEIEQKQNCDEDSDVENAKNRSFFISFTFEEWEKLFHEIEYHGKDRFKGSRMYSTLKPFQWTNIIYTKFYNVTKIACPITFRRCNIRENGAVYLKIEGNCKVCQSCFIGLLYEKPIYKTDVLISCVYEGDFLHCNTEKKRRVMGDKKKEYLQKLVNEKECASTIRQMEAKKLMSFGDREPSNIPTLNALRRMKYTHSKERKIHDDPIISLSILKETLPYKEVIHDIGYDRFFIHYWSVFEINNYRLYARGTKIPKVSIDATGSVVKKIVLPSGRKTAAIFLYQIVVRDCNIPNQFAVGHMLSERNDNNSITYWLGEWSRNDIPLPKIVVVDQSLALMMAVTKTFTQYSSFKFYLDVCSMLLNKCEISIPLCMIRNDFAHVMHIISGWVEIKDSPRRVKDFYLRAIALIIACEHFEKVKDLLKLIFTVAMNEDEGIDLESKPIPSELAKQKLKALISGLSTDDILNDEASSNENCDLESLYTECENQKTSYYQQILEIYTTCEEESRVHKGDHDNLHHSKNLAKKLLKFCHLLPTWSAIMNPIFKYGSPTESSSSSESMFNEIKNRWFTTDTLPIKVDKFVSKHIDLSLGAMNLMRARYTNLACLEEIDEKHVENIDIVASNIDLDKDDDLILTINKNVSYENWMGQGIPMPIKKRKRNYLEPDPTILKHEDTKAKNSVLGILRNANCLSLKAVQINDAFYTFKNTCAFDSIIQILFCAYTDSIAYSEFINKNANKTVFELIKNGVRDGITVQSYRKRGKILLDIFKKETRKENPKHFYVDAATTVYRLLNEIFQEYPSMEETFTCNSCATVSNFIKTVITVHQSHNTIEYFLDSLKNEFNIKKKCSRCGSTGVKHTKLNSHLFFELMWSCLKPQNNLDIKGELFKIPEVISLLGKNYFLRGAISFIPPLGESINSIGHYLAFCWRIHNKKWEKHDDLTTQIKSVQGNTMVQQCQILIYST